MKTSIPLPSFAAWAMELVSVNIYTISVSADPTDGGNVSGDGTYNHGTQVTVKADPATGYRFVNWTEGGIQVSTSATYTFSATAPRNLVAHFALGTNTHTLTYTAGPGGSIAGTSPQTVLHGGSGTEVEAVPAAGYHFTSWSDGVPTAKRTDTNVQGDISVTARFARDEPAKDRWSDISDEQWQLVYGISVDRAYEVAQGYGDGTFRPGEPLNRAHCAKMIVDGFGVPKYSPSLPTFSDVPASHLQYAWIEGGYAAKVVNGYTDGTYRPHAQITRQQFNSMLARILVHREIEARGAIQGSTAQYATLDAWFAAEGQEYLARFVDSSELYRDHEATSAYLVFRGVIQGVERGGLRYLDPLKSLTRAQAVAMIVRAGLIAQGF